MTLGVINDLNDEVVAHGINADGAIVGQVTYIESSEEVTRAFIWVPEDDLYGLDAGIQLLDDSFPGFDGSVAFDINDAAIVVGYVEINELRRPYIWDLSGTFGSGFIVNGTDTDGATAFDINNDASPLIVGAPVPVSAPGNPNGFYDPLLAGTGKNGFVYRLDTTPAFDVLEPSLSSKFSIVFGVSETDGSDNWTAGGMMACEVGVQCQTSPACQSEARGQFWTDDSTMADDLEEVALCTGSVIPRSVGFAVSPGGTVVGLGKNPNDLAGNGDARRWAFVWENGPTSTPTELPKFDDDPTDEDAAYDIRVPTSGSMEIVGGSFEFGVALLWRHNGTDWSDDPINLDEATCRAGIFSQLRRATGINESGWVCGWGLDPCSELHSFVLIPSSENPTCAADFANTGPCGAGSTCSDGAVNVFDLLTLLANWSDDVKVGSPGDITDDGTNNQPDGVVNVFDLLELLAQWGSCIDATTAESPSLEYEVTDAGLTMDDWDDFEDVMMNEPDEKVRANWRCWMERYLSDCSVCPACPGVDPFQ